MPEYPRLEVETDPIILRLAASDLEQNYVLGIGGLPLSLPGTLRSLADYLDKCQEIDEKAGHNDVKLQVNPISPRYMLGLDSDDGI